ncbi:MAG TPA: VIT1/CCC1 transporter family protein [Polyangiaceae bacterium]
MPTTHHVERHFLGSDAVRDVVIGMSDGLTVPFALAAGLSGAVAVSRVVVTAGLAEIAAGALAMGLGGFLAARSDAEHYQSEEARERREVQEIPAEEQREVEEALARYGLTAAEVAPVVAGLKRRPKAWVEFMMRFELGLEKPDPGRAVRSALTIAVSYIVGGLIPLAPYFFAKTPQAGLPLSVGVTMLALFVFGFVKGRFTGAPPLRSALQTVVVGGLAAAAAFGLARLVS